MTPKAALPINVIGNVMAWTNIDRLPGASLTNIPLEGLRVEIQGGASGFTDANGDFNIPHTGTTNVTVRVRMAGQYLRTMNALQGTNYDQTFTATPGTPLQIQIYTQGAVQFDRSQTTTYHFTDQVNRFTRGILGNLTQLNRTDQVQAVVNQSSSCNATYTSGSNLITFYHQTSSCPNTAYKSVVLHEWGHGLDDAFGGIDRTDGQSEGSADVVAMVFSDDPSIGPDFFGPGSEIRTGLNTRQYPSGSNTHERGESWMGYCWDVRGGLVNTLGMTAGLQRLRELFIGVFVADPNSHPNAVMNVFLLDDNDGNLLNGTPNYETLSMAAMRRNIPFPRRSQGSYEAFGSGCPGTGAGVTNCFGSNENATSARFTSQIIWTIKITAQNAATITGFELQTASTTGQQETMPTFIYRPGPSGAPLPTPEQSSTMVVNPTMDYYSTPMQHFNVAAGETFFIGYQASADYYTPQAANGTPNECFNLIPGLGWLGPVPVSMSFRLRCSLTTGGTPVMETVGIPNPGATVDLRLSQAPNNVPSFLTLGFSETQWLSLNLPIDLTSGGAPGVSDLHRLGLRLPGVHGRLRQGANEPHHSKQHGTDRPAHLPPMGHRRHRRQRRRPHRLQRHSRTDRRVARGVCSPFFFRRSPCAARGSSKPPLEPPPPTLQRKFSAIPDRAPLGR